MYGLKRVAFQSIFVFTILMLCPWLVNASQGAVNTQKIAHFMQYLTNCSHTNASPQECLSKAKNTYFKTFSLEDDLTTREAGLVAFLIYYNEMLDLLNEHEEGFLGDFNKAIDSIGWATGHSSQAVMDAIQECAPAIRTKEGRNWQKYAERTTAYAFGVAGDLALQRYEKYQEHWRCLELKDIQRIRFNAL